MVLLNRHPCRLRFLRLEATRGRGNLAERPLDAGGLELRQVRLRHDSTLVPRLPVQILVLLLLIESQWIWCLLQKIFNMMFRSGGKLLLHDGDI